MHTLIIICKMRNEIVIIPPSVLTITSLQSNMSACQLLLLPCDIISDVSSCLVLLVAGPIGTGNVPILHNPFLKSPFLLSCSLKGNFIDLLCSVIRMTIAAGC